MIFDSHAHYDDRRYNDDREETLQKVFDSGVSNIMNIGSNLANSYNCAALAEKYEQIHAAVGVHPHDVYDTPEDTIEQLAELLERPKVVAVGEIGLDYHYENTIREAQQDWFRRQMRLAADTDYPVVIHDRDAHQDSLNITREFPCVKGVYHCYAGSAEMAQELIKLGYYISFTGVITFKNARKTLDVLSTIPMDRLLVETDCPYLAPEPFRGKRNDSSYLPYTIQTIAEVKGISEEEVIRITSDNAKVLFGIK